MGRANEIYVRNVVGDFRLCEHLNCNVKKTFFSAAFGGIECLYESCAGIVMCFRLSQLSYLFASRNILLFTAVHRVVQKHEYKYYLRCTC